MSRKVPWLIAIAAAVVLVFVLLVPRAQAAHPDARPGITAELVLPASTVPRTPGAAEAYAAARGIPATLDGLYCYCQCSKHSGHRSLLTCFESEHGAFCDICIGEAILADDLTRRAAALADIRKAIDERFGRS